MTATAMNVYCLRRIHFFMDVESKIILMKTCGHNKEFLGDITLSYDEHPHDEHRRHGKITLQKFHELPIYRKRDYCLANNMMKCTKKIFTTRENYFQNFTQICLYRNLSMIYFVLVNYRDDIEMLNQGLFGACCGGHLDIIKLLLELDATNFNSGFDGACKGGFMNIINMMIELGATKFEDGLYFACDGNHVEIVRMLINKGATQYIRDGFNYACMNGNLEIINLLLDNGAMDYLDDEISEVFFRGHRDAVKLLLDKGANVDGMCQNLRLACKYGDLQMINFLLEHGADNLDEGLCGACMSGRLDIIDLMISKGANYWNKGLYGACMGGHLDIIDFMISKGANYWNKGLTGACMKGKFNAMKLMISKGANKCHKYDCKKTMAEHLEVSEDFFI